jgi:hypothetical protein
MHEISSKYDRSRADYIENVTELADFVFERKLNKNIGKSSCDGSQVKAVESRKVETRACHNCKKKGYIARD